MWDQAIINLLIFRCIWNASGIFSAISSEKWGMVPKIPFLYPAVLQALSPADLKGLQLGGQALQLAGLLLGLALLQAHLGDQLPMGQRLAHRI